MVQEQRLVEAFKSNGIKRILLIDDAYDPPVVDDDSCAVLADFLESEAGRTICGELGVEGDLLNVAITAALEGEADSSELEEVHRILYAEYVQKNRPQYDPGGRFRTIKGVALAVLYPLRVLLSRCGDDIEVKTAGLIDGSQRYTEFCPQVLFLDYYLGEDVPASGDVSVKSKTAARKASLDLLRQVVKTANGEGIPAIVLMSSRQVSDVDQYRHDAGDKQIMSLRFQFLKKKLVKQEGKKIVIDHAAADVLLDTSQCYLFGKVLQQALAQWKKGATLALSDFIKDVGDLDTKDFAYLLRFRLREAGQPLSEYLEWLFGECLKGLIDEKVEWAHTSFLELDSNKKLDETIEGAFDGPSVKIARFFQRVRVDTHRVTTHSAYRLGDLYAQSNGSDLRAVITPDCDLVVRKGKTKVKNILTMGGKLNTYDQDDSVVDSFFFRDNIPYSVRWNPKDLETFPISGQKSLHEKKEFQFLGTLRPLYAQEMQRRALTDLSRVGLPVAPALGVNATATVWVRTKDSDKPFKLIQIKSSPLATIIPPRAGQSGRHHILLRRPFVHELVQKLRAIDPEEMQMDDATSLRTALKGSNTIYDRFLRKGGAREGKGIFGTQFVFGEKPISKKCAPWLQIVLNVSDEAMEELRVIDPLVVVPFDDRDQ